MILNNYYKMCKQLYSQITLSNPWEGSAVILSNGNSSTGCYPSPSSSRGEKDPLCFQISAISSSYIFTSLPGAYTYSGFSLAIVFGDNDTPVTPDDYTTSAFSNISLNSGTIEGKTLHLIFRNNNAQTITIKDVMIFSNCCCYSDTGTMPAIIREVLPEPITVEAGNYFTFNLTKSYGD